METEKKQTLAELVANANKKTTDVKKITAKVESKTEDYRKIPVAPFYEINSKGVVRTVDKKVPVLMKKGTGKFYLRVDPKDNTKRKLFTPEQLIESLPKQQTEKPAKKETVKKNKPVKTQKENKEIRKPDAAAQSIIDSDVSNYIKSYKLNKLNYTNQEIASYIGVSAGNVSRDLWMVKNGHREVPK